MCEFVRGVGVVLFFLLLVPRSKRRPRLGTVGDPTDLNGNRRAGIVSAGSFGFGKYFELLSLIKGIKFFLLFGWSVGIGDEFAFVGLYQRGDNSASVKGVIDFAGLLILLWWLWWFLGDIELLLDLRLVDKWTVASRIGGGILEEGRIVISFVLEQVIVSSDVVVAIGGDVVDDLGGLHRHAHGLHQRHDPLVGEYGVCAHDDPLRLVFEGGLVVPLGLLDLRDGVAGFGIDVQDVFEHLLGLAG